MKLLNESFTTGTQQEPELFPLLSGCSLHWWCCYELPARTSIFLLAGRCCPVCMCVHKRMCVWRNNWTPIKHWNLSEDLKAIPSGKVVADQASSSSSVCSKLSLCYNQWQPQTSFITIRSIDSEHHRWWPGAQQLSVPIRTNCVFVTLRNWKLGEEILMMQVKKRFMTF